MPQLRINEIQCNFTNNLNYAWPKACDSTHMEQTTSMPLNTCKKQECKENAFRSVLACSSQSQRLAEASARLLPSESTSKCKGKCFLKLGQHWRSPREALAELIRRSFLTVHSPIHLRAIVRELYWVREDWNAICWRQVWTT